tara:strand:+ start:175 stop:360 length:186 start_codon:yes stop_codon:yes gene_type:complete
MEKMLEKSQISTLRESGVINDNEVVLSVGDLFVAENVVTKERRVISGVESALNESRRVLRG